MIKSALLATALAVGFTSFASAQGTPKPNAPPPPPPATAAMPGPGGDARPAPGDMPPPPPPMGKGVEIRLGRDAGIRVNCGDEPMEACLAAAKPLTDRIPDMSLPLAPTTPVGEPIPPAN